MELSLRVSIYPSALAAFTITSNVILYGPGPTDAIAYGPGPTDLILYA